MLVPTKGRFAGPGTVIYAGAEELGLVRQAQPAVFDSCGADRGSCHDLGSISEISDALTCGEFASNPFAALQDFRAEAKGLFARALGQVGPADAAWKTQIILDFGTAGCLSADSPSFDHHGFESFRRSVNGGAESRRPRPINGQVILGARRITKPS